MGAWPELLQEAATNRNRRSKSPTWQIRFRNILNCTLWSCNIGPGSSALGTEKELEPCQRNAGFIVVRGSVPEREAARERA